MASSTEDSVQVRANLGSDSRRKVRIVAKIRDSTDLEVQSSNGSPACRIFVQKPEPQSSEGVTISFTDQPTTSRKESYKLDYCYDQNEDIGKMFSREVKPLVSGIFRGLNASVLAYGAKGSGKTYTIQGSNEKPGLGPLAMEEILSIAEETGSSITMSWYEVYQDHVYDLLEPKRQEVLVLEGAGGRIQLKGLSQIPVKSISDFNKIYFPACTSRKPAQKHTNDVPHKSHKGLIIYVSANDKDSNTNLVGKMNFVDLAGFESTRMNKSLYALQNVVHALNANERVPYRESKLTRMLQDTLGGTSQILMVTCLNPYPCQDTIYTVSFASRSCQVGKICLDTKRTMTVTRSALYSPKSGRPLSLSSTSAKKHNILQSKFMEKKANFVSSEMKARKLFDGANPANSSVQESSSSDIASSVKHSIQEESCLSEISSAIVPLPLQEEEVSLTIASKEIEPFPENEAISLQNEYKHPDITSVSACDTTMLIAPEEEKENNSDSPPLSERLRELSNSLKSLCSSTPLSIKMPQESNNPCNSQVFVDVMEPKTPRTEQCLRFNDNLELANIGTPRGKFNLCSSGLKNSLVREYLRFLNTADKEELKGMKGIGEKRANYILELRDELPEPFKDLDDLVTRTDYD
ncbi:PREDICTED: kinesin-like protein KIN-10C isoform X2 [Nelumbo nucifera]|uniref:Kinesin-like protein KIN-10C isoform X2 n=1 Tax=Nelumbo nucifera TaxID=4432 RepID=A0A1U8PXY6_NELNU|nr:PREDICTED: kinesin-like protein KIN-10C isoform X2 [Nelumbo nucifera]